MILSFSFQPETFIKLYAEPAKRTINVEIKAYGKLNEL
jgi:hypothetical protein